MKLIVVIFLLLLPKAVFSQFGIGKSELAIESSYAGQQFMFIKSWANHERHLTAFNRVTSYTYLFSNETHLCYQSWDIPQHQDLVDYTIALYNSNLDVVIKDKEWSKTTENGTISIKFMYNKDYELFGFFHSLHKKIER